MKHKEYTWPWSKIFLFYVLVLIIYPLLKLIDLILRLTAKKEYKKAKEELEIIDSDGKQRKVIYEETLLDREN